ncbi:MAG TPA: hypothetical protein DCK95_00245 [Anaerolineaceae bacterium]|uniref:Putative acetyl-CoA synthetase n=1 Tax=Anaerolinea thermophila TaxID=167964 RepID=A0A101FYM7_9CHLR|nr:MAG: Putative acetyl-CoA synthetase [Anaerolinea thermophila]HAF60739.1 hypothetical protein [Anaerolineaceae bacterium]
MQDNLSSFFEPQSVALIGASSNPSKLSYGILKNISQYGYRGGIYPINPKSNEILGFPCYSSILDVPEEVDLTVIILPAEIIPQVIDDCGKKGVKACIVISGGFKELGEDGKQREKELEISTRKYGIRIIGPNCVGNINVYSGLNTTFIKGMPVKGGIGFVSQSGAVCGGVVDHVVQEGIGFSHLISLGNEMDVNETDMISYLADDENTHVIACYVESIRDGARFMEVAKHVSKKKPIVLLKAGKSELGAKAVSSHTGSLAGSHTAYSTAFKQAGVIEVSSLRALLQTSMALDMQPLPQNKQAVIFTNAGGPAALLSDSLDEHGLKLANLNEKTQQMLKAKLNPAAQTMNPVDMLGGATQGEYAQAMRVVKENNDAGILLPVLVPQALVDPVAVARAIISETQNSQRTTIACMVGKQSTQEAKLLLHQQHIPLLDYPEDVGEVLGGMLRYKAYHDAPAETLEISRIAQKEEARSYFHGLADQKQFGEAETRPLLELYGVKNVEGKRADSLAEAQQAAKELGYPVVIKVISDEILHKSDAGGIRLDIKDERSLADAYQDMLTDVRSHAPEAVIKGVLVEKMQKQGEEVIVGMKWDANFGALLMFGMGGIYVEAFKDVSFRIAPVSEVDVRNMIAETAAGKILNGLRGIRYDIDAVVQTILALSQVCLDFPEIQELEINPLKVFSKGDGAAALDSRMIIK